MQLSLISQSHKSAATKKIMQMQVKNWNQKEVKGMSSVTLIMPLILVPAELV